MSGCCLVTRINPKEPVQSQNWNFLLEKVLKMMEELQKQPCGSKLAAKSTNQMTQLSAWCVSMQDGN